MQASRANIFHAHVHDGCHASQFRNAAGFEGQRGPLGFDERRVLLGKRVLRFRHDPNKVRFGQRFEFHANGESSLQFGNQIAGLGYVKCTGGDEEHMIGLHHAIARLYVGAFNDGQQISLHPLARHIGSAGLSAFTGNLVDLVEKDDAHGFNSFQCVTGNVVEIDQLVEFFIKQNTTRLGDLDGAAFFFLRHHVAKPFRHALHTFRGTGGHAVRHTRT